MDFFRTITQFGFGILSVAAMVFLFTTVPLEAAKQPKVDICHLDPDTGLFKLISVTLKAQEAHFNHGDKVPTNGECNAPPALVFARVYINVDPTPGYQEGSDIIIAELVDANGDNAVSVGDVLELSAYPKSLTDLSDRGTFQVQSIPVTDVDLVSAGRIELGVGGHEFVGIWSASNTIIPGVELYYEDGGVFGTVLQFQDISANALDNIRIQNHQGLLSQPEVDFNETATAPGDNDFMNIEINLAGL